MKLKSISIKGYKSIDTENGASLEFGDVTVLLGANGVGKSNLISFFNMLSYIMTGSLQNYVAERGFADSFLYFGAKQTRQIQAEVEFSDDNAIDRYKFILTHAVGDILIFTEETLTYEKKGAIKPYTISLNPAVKESDLLQFIKKEEGKPYDKQTANFILKLLRNCRVFHFHDTSSNAKIRGQGYIEDNQYLNSDAGNLAAFLYRLRENVNTKIYYEKIIRYIQKAMPQFNDFDLHPRDRKSVV